MPDHVICTFPAVSIDQLIADRAKYPGDDVVLRFIKSGDDHLMQVWDLGGYGGDPIDQSGQCPGAPGCP